MCAWRGPLRGTGASVSTTSADPARDPALDRALDPARTVVVLDLDGTLVDSVYHHVVAWQCAFRDVGRPVAAPRIHEAIGMGGDRLVEHVAGASAEHAVGDDVLVGRKPTGMLVLTDLLPGRHLYLFATGTGLAPFMSIIRDPDTYERFEKIVLVHGTRKVGSTMNVTATPWLAGTYPTTRATMSYQWKRNGVAIKGATGRTYKLVSADRGKKLSVTATAKRYGYTTGSTTSTAKSIS